MHAHDAARGDRDTRLNCGRVHGTQLDRCLYHVHTGRLRHDAAYVRVLCVTIIQTERPVCVCVVKERPVYVQRFASLRNAIGAS